MTQGCKTVVAIAARAVISSVLAFYGLPPSLPKPEQLEALAQGELGVLAVELMKELTNFNNLEGRNKELGPKDP